MATDEEVNEWVLEYQAGADRLGLVLEAVRPMVNWAVGQVVRRGLPPTLDRHDAEQEAILQLMLMAKRWRSEHGDFGGYVRSALYWNLWRSVSLHRPERRSTTGVAVYSRPHDDLVAESHMTYDDLGLAEWVDILAGMPPIDRAAVRGMVLGLPATTAVERLGYSKASAYRIYRRTAARLRTALGFGLSPQEVKFLRGLYSIARGGRVPSRRVVCDRLGVNEVEYRDRLARLVDLGLVVGRKTKASGRLAYPTYEEALAAVQAG